MCLGLFQSSFNLTILHNLSPSSVSLLRLLSSSRCTECKEWCRTTENGFLCCYYLLICKISRLLIFREKQFWLFLIILVVFEYYSNMYTTSCNKLEMTHSENQVCVKLGTQGCVIILDKSLSDYLQTPKNIAPHFINYPCKKVACCFLRYYTPLKILLLLNHA